MPVVDPGELFELGVGLSRPQSPMVCPAPSSGVGPGSKSLPAVSGDVWDQRLREARDLGRNDLLVAWLASYVPDGVWADAVRTSRLIAERPVVADRLFIKFSRPAPDSGVGPGSKSPQRIRCGCGHLPYRHTVWSSTYSRWVPSGCREIGCGCRRYLVHGAVAS